MANGLTHLSRSGAKAISASNVDPMLTESRNVDPTLTESRNVDLTLTESRNVDLTLTGSRNVDRTLTEPRNVDRTLTESKNPSGLGDQLGRGFYRIENRLRIRNEMDACIIKGLAHFSARETAGAVKAGKVFVPTTNPDWTRTGERIHSNFAGQDEELTAGRISPGQDPDRKKNPCEIRGTA
jgi:hypothetical protein